MGNPDVEDTMLNNDPIYEGNRIDMDVDSAVISAPDGMEQKYFDRDDVSKDARRNEEKYGSSPPPEDLEDDRVDYRAQPRMQSNNNSMKESRQK